MSSPCVPASSALHASGVMSSRHRLNASSSDAPTPLAISSIHAALKHALTAGGACQTRDDDRDRALTAIVCVLWVVADDEEVARSSPEQPSTTAAEINATPTIRAENFAASR